MELTPELALKRDRLAAILREMRGVAVAFSGGIDSTVVAKAAFLALGSRAVAVTADSASVARTELADARALTSLIGIRHVVVQTEEFDNPEYLKNDGSRCYHCKTELYSTVAQLLPELGVPVVVSGANLDDRGDYRPGLVAAAEHSVRHPCGGRVQEGRRSRAWRGIGTFQRGTSRPRRACRAVSPGACGRPGAELAASRLPRRSFALGARVSRGITRQNLPASRCRKPRLRSSPPIQ